MSEARPNSRRIDEGTSSSLLEQVRNQDEVAWDQFVALYSPLVWRWCQAQGLRPPDIEDVSQEVFRAVHRALPGFRKEKPGDSFRAWLRVITINKIRDHCGRAAVVAVGGSTANLSLARVPAPEWNEDEDEDHEVGVLYRRAVQVLRIEFEDRTWQAFWRSAVDDEPVEHVAASLKMTTNAVYVACSRVRRRLRELLADAVPENTEAKCTSSVRTR